MLPLQDLLSENWITSTAEAAEAAAATATAPLPAYNPADSQYNVSFDTNPCLQPLRVDSTHMIQYTAAVLMHKLCSMV